MSRLSLQPGERGKSARRGGRAQGRRGRTAVNGGQIDGREHGTEVKLQKTCKQAISVMVIEDGVGLSIVIACTLPQIRWRASR